MTDIASLRMAVDTSEVRRAGVELGRLERAASSVAGTASGMASAFGAVGGTLAALGLAAQARQALLLADAYSSLTGRLELAARGTGDLTRLQRDLFSVAQSQRKDLEAVTSLYISGANAAGELGASQQDLLRFTTAVSAALTINNTAAGAASGVLLQLGQAIGGANIQAQEFNSLIDGARPLLVVAAKNIEAAGGSVSRLKTLVNEGKITSREFFAAIVKGSEELEQAARSMPLTIGQSTTQASNSILVLVGSIDQLTGTSRGISSFVSSASTRIDELTEAFKRAKVEGRSFSDVIADRFRGALGGGESIADMRDRARELEEVLASGTINRPWVVREYRRELERLRAAMAPNPNDGSFDALESRRMPGRPVPPPPPPPPKTGAKPADPFADEMRSLRERLALLGSNTEAERVLTEAALGKFGRITPAQRAELQALAEAIDAREQHARLIESEASAREAAGRLSQAAAATLQAETDRLIDGNRALREEIELIGATEEAKLAIEVARISSARAILEERAAMLQNAGAAEAEIQALQQQITLLREREGLLVRRADLQNFNKPLEENASGVARRAGADTYTEVRDALSAAFRDTNNPIKAFAQALGNAVFTRVTSSLADAMALQLVGSTGGGGLVGAALGAIGSIFGGQPIVPQGGTTGDFARFDRRMATGTNYVPYDGMRAILHEGEAVVPKRFNPAAGGSMTGAPRVTYSPTTIVQVDARSDQAQVQKIAAAQAAEANRRQLEQLRAMGVL